MSGRAILFLFVSCFSFIICQETSTLASECVEGSFWEENCRNCTCIEGLKSCIGEECINKTVTSETPVEERTCEYTSKGARWRKNCNWCRCHKTEGRPMCTRRGCPVALEIHLRESTQCEIDAKWKKDRCNWCTCVNDEPVCESKPCNIGGSTSLIKRPRTNSRVRNYKSRRAEECVVGTVENSRWRRSCNWCRCHAQSGRGVCTRRRCPSDYEIRAVNQPRCEGDVLWKRDNCNWCRCVNDDDVCEETLCDEEKEEEDEDTSAVISAAEKEEEDEDTSAVISATVTNEQKFVEVRNNYCVAKTEKDRWTQQCNWCTCTGKSAACTLKGCLSDNFELQCRGQAEWKMDCNWCKCINEKPNCTTNICTKAEKERMEPICHVGSIETSYWTVDCNRCHCSNRSVSCTEKACSPQETNIGYGICEGNPSWKYDCNWCQCMHGRVACTEKFCEGEIESTTSAVVTDVADESSNCKEGSNWEENCNTCYCQQNLVFCTMIDCNPTPETSFIMEQLFSTQLEQLVKRNELGTPECKRGSRWRKACNWCSCNEGGISFCTLKGCLRENDPSEEQCTEGSEWFDDCNSCLCHNGTAVCTSSDCTKETALESRTDNEEWCTDGSRWRRDACNWCTCHNGKGVCTALACLRGRGDANSEPECENNSQWIKKAGDMCSWCTCGNGFALCDPLLLCDTELPIRISKAEVAALIPKKVEPSCTDGSQWMKNCNWCSCASGIAVCNLAACLHPETAEKKNGTCKGESEWKIRCNWCKCVDGKGVCSELPCDEETSINAKPAAPPPPNAITFDEGKGECVTGNSWMEGCNTCICIKTIKVCTKKSCDAQIDRPQKCSDTKRWKVSCNVCQCFYGQPTCTRRACRSIDLPNICYEPALRRGAKLCAGFIPKWTYMSSERICMQIVYGGCGGTENLFHTEEDCKMKCGGFRSLSESNEGKVQNTKSRCSEEVEHGPCFAFMSRVAFVQERNRCEKFIYGGCQGTRNNFHTAEECYNECGGNPPVVDPKCDRAKCDWKRFAHYFIKKCQPIYEGGSCCPSKFECGKMEEVSEEHCIYKDVLYRIGQSIPIEDPCSQGCVCRKRGARPARIVCPIVECPSLFRAPRPNCRSIYAEDSCCSISEECRDENVPADATLRSPVCVWNGQTSKLGDKMYFDDYPCQQCICTPAFDGPMGLGCKKIDCGFEFRYRHSIMEGCTPLYFEDGCCPIDWVCPEDTRLSRPPQDHIALASPTRSATCSSGNVTVPAGSPALVSDCNIKCSCKTPPDFTCVQYRSCEKAEEGAIRPQQSESKCAAAQCSSNCSIEIEPSSGCPTCICSSFDFKCAVPKCSEKCHNPRIEFDESKGCSVCQCDCPDMHSCPSNCIVQISKDPDTGCQVCQCDPNDSFNVF